MILRVSGVPDEGCHVDVSHAGFDTAMEDPENAADVMGKVTLNTETIIVMEQHSRPGGRYRNANGVMMGRTSISQSVSRGPSGPAADSLKLLLTLDARSSVGELMLPLDEGMVRGHGDDGARLKAGERGFDH